MSDIVNTKVRQPRVHTLESGRHTGFEHYLDRHSYEEQNRAYVLDIGCGLIEPASDDGKFSRLSFPHNKSKSGYACVVIPSEQIMASGDRTIFGDSMVDIDLGDKTKKHTTKYVGMDGKTHEEFIATRMIERYLNFTASAYESGLKVGLSSMPGITSGQSYYQSDNVYRGYIYKDTLHNKFRESDLFEGDKTQQSMSDAFVCAGRLTMSSYNRFKEFIDADFASDGKCDYDKFRQEFVSKFEDTFNEDDAAAIFPVTESLTKENRPLYMRSLVAGLNDRLKISAMYACYSVYPPEKDSTEYNKLIDMGFKEQHIDEIHRKHELYDRKYRTSHEVRQRSNGSNQMMFDTSMSFEDDLPFM